MAQQAESASLRDILSLGEIAAFCTQLSMILKSGISIAEGVGIMIEDTPSSQGKEILKGVLERMEEGSPLFMALGASGIFPKYMVDMVEIGEATGRLDNVLDSLVVYYEREEAVSKSIRNAVAYPLVMIVMMILVITVLIVRVMPVFSAVFESLGSEMSGFSRGVLLFGEFLRRNAVGVAAVIIITAVLILLLALTPKGRALTRRFRSSFFLTRKMYAKIASAHFASAMALMLSSGLDTDRSLEMVYKLVENPVMRRKVEDCQMRIADGATFSDALVKSELFSGVYGRMVTVGFKAGALDHVMQKLAERYEEEIEAQISGVITVLEPVLVAILSIIVGLILLSVMLPLMEIMSSIG